MKYSKVAAVVAGSVVAVGMAAPAFAAGGSAVDGSFAKDMPTMPTSINGGVEQALAQQPLQKAVDNTKVGETLETVTGTAQQLRETTSADALLGQMTDAAKGDLLGTVTGAVPGASLLGGLPLGG